MGIYEKTEFDVEAMIGEIFERHEADFGVKLTKKELAAAMKAAIERKRQHFIKSTLDDNYVSDLLLAEKCLSKKKAK